MRRYLVIFLLIIYLPDVSFCKEDYNIKAIIQSIQVDSLFLEYNKLYSDSILNFNITDTVHQSIEFTFFIKEISDCLGLDSSDFINLYYKINKWRDKYINGNSITNNNIISNDLTKYNDSNSPIHFDYSINIFDSYTIITVSLNYDPFKYYQKNKKNCIYSLIYIFIFSSFNDYCYFGLMIN